jgi:hypothetical protein
VGYCKQDFSFKRHTAISIKVVHEQIGKVEYERERLLGIANKLMNFQSDSQQPLISRTYSTFPLCSWTTLIEIAVYLENRFIYNKLSEAILFEEMRRIDLLWEIVKYTASLL